MDRWQKSNCLIFAIAKAIKEDQYIVIRKSHKSFKWPFCHYHFLVIPKEIVDECAMSFVPDQGDLGDWPSPLFKGHVKHGDDESQTE